MSESVLAQGTWAEDGDSDGDTKPLPPSPEVGSYQVSVVLYTDIVMLGGVTIEFWTFVGMSVVLGLKKVMVIFGVLPNHI